MVSNFLVSIGKFFRLPHSTIAGSAGRIWMASSKLGMQSVANDQQDNH